MELQMRTRFNKAWEAIVARKKGKMSCLSRIEYQDVLEKVRRLKMASETSATALSERARRFLLRYDIAIKDGREWLVKPQEGVAPDLLKLYVTTDETFDVLHEAYVDNGRGSKNRMYKRIREKYCNVTEKAVVTYLRLRTSCGELRREVEARVSSPEVQVRGLLPTPSSSQPRVNGMTSAYFGFVDMYRYPRDGYTCIMVHCNTDTLFTHMVPLKSMEAGHVAAGLLNIYAKVGSIPNFIDAPYDRGYISSIVEHMKSAWRGAGDCCIMIRCSDDQDTIITGWNTVQNMMGPWISDARFQSDWPYKLKYIQKITNKGKNRHFRAPPSTMLSSTFNPSSV